MQRRAIWRQLALSVIAASVILILIRVATETDWSRDTIATLVRSSAVSGLIGFTLLFGLQLLAAGFVKSRFQLAISFIAVTLAAIAIVSATVPTINWLIGSMAAPNAPGESRNDFAAYLAQYFFAIYWRLIVIMGPLFLAFNWRWFADRLDGPHAQPMAPIPATPAAHSVDEEAAEPAEEDSVTSEPQEPVDGWLMEKLPMPKRGALWAISSELHYLRIYTDVGNDLILMRLSDAVDRLAESDGIQIHRSHWVSRAGIRDLVRKGSAFEIELHSGERLPVSRANAASVKDFCKAS